LDFCVTVIKKQGVYAVATPHTIIDQVLSLPVDDRIDMVERLLLSLNLPTQAEIDSQWATEAERRIKEIERDTV